jgi:hypothetical protein
LWGTGQPAAKKIVPEIIAFIAGKYSETSYIAEQAEKEE